MVKYSTVSIPKEYRSVAEFSLEAIKIRLDEIRAQLEEEKGIRKKKVERALKNIKRKLRLK